MKKTIVIVSLCLSSLFAVAQSKVETINLKGTDYTVNKNFPADIIGKYLYERGKNGEEPIIQLNADGTGLFQPHMSPAIPIKFWIDCDAQGVIRKREGANGRYGVTLLIQYGANDNQNYATGTYNLMEVAVVKDQGFAVIWGERFKTL